LDPPDGVPRLVEMEMTVQLPGRGLAERPKRGDGAGGARTPLDKALRQGERGAHRREDAGDAGNSRHELRRQVRERAAALAQPLDGRPLGIDDPVRDAPALRLEVPLLLEVVDGPARQRAADPVLDQRRLRASVERREAVEGRLDLSHVVEEVRQRGGFALPTAALMTRVEPPPPPPPPGTPRPRARAPPRSPGRSNGSPRALCPFRPPWWRRMA